MLLNKNIIGFSKTGGFCIIATKLYRQISTTALHFFATINKSGSSNHTLCIPKLPSTLTENAKF